MESLDFTDDELKVRATESRKLSALARTHGESQVASHYDGIVRAIEAEAKARDLEL